jgi:hypothetical protein
MRIETSDTTKGKKAVVLPNLRDAHVGWCAANQGWVEPEPLIGFRRSACV